MNPQHRSPMPDLTKDANNGQQNSNLQNSKWKRSAHDKDHPYSMVSNALINDKSISFECRMMLIYLLSKPADWQLMTQDIMNQSGWGRDKARDIVNEAVTAGYVKKVFAYENGLRRLSYEFSEMPIFKNIVPEPENPGPEIPTPENQGRYKRKTPQKTENTKPLPPSADGAYSSRNRRKGLRANGENPRAKALKERRDWIDGLRAKWGAQFSKLKIEVHSTDEKLYVNQANSTLSETWLLKDLAGPGVQEAVVKTLQRMGVKIAA